jgi:hypothetical protein
MTTPDKSTRRVSNSVKQLLFVGGVLWLLLNVLALAVTLGTRIALPFAAVLLVDVVGVLIGGLVWLARRIWPAEGKER